MEAASRELGRLPHSLGAFALRLSAECGVNIAERSSDAACGGQPERNRECPLTHAAPDSVFA
jgi:hypothetical protein